MYYVFPGPCQPIRFEELIPVYTSDQIDVFGVPDNWGVVAYLVIESRESMKPMVTDWKMEQEMRGSTRPIHRYNRVKRFESTLYQLLGYRGDVPLELIQEIKEIGYDSRGGYIWNSIREILKIKKTNVYEEEYWDSTKKIFKTKRIKVYYDRIPLIIQMLGEDKRIDLNDNFLLLQRIIDEFKLFNSCYERIRGSRKYFPNLRFVALKLLKTFGADIQYDIPLLRTKRKIEPMELLWDRIQMFSECYR